MKKVLFLHGLESRPGGTKPTFLSRKGYKVFNPHLPKSSFEESIKIAQSVIDVESPDVVIGSSRGAAVAMCLNTDNCGVILIAPAWTRFSHSQNMDVLLSSDTMIVHSRHDSIVDFSDSELLSKNSGAKLVSAGACHRMSDNDALEAMLDTVRWLTR